MSSLSNNEPHFKPYNITLVGLQMGQHDFTFSLDDAFFAHFGKAPLEAANFTAKVELERKSDFFVLGFDINGTSNVECDRCLGRYDMPLRVKREVLVKYQHAMMPNKEDEINILYILPETTDINIAQLLFEFVVLNLPIKKIPCDYGDFECNEIVLNKLDEANRLDAGNTEQEQKIDPRWAALQKLKNKDKK